MIKNLLHERAVDYSRVSTDDENQLTSIINQQKDALYTIEQNGWEHVGSYVDEGKSGTTTKGRNEYNKLVADLSTDKFDIIVCKSQDRLNRNTFEWYNFINKLLINGKKLYFYLDHKFYNPDEDALISGITAIMDETYSRNLSKKINNAHRRRQESGTCVVLSNATYGYDKINKQVVINEEEAKMIRMIYEMSAQDIGAKTISKQLAVMGYRNRTGGLITSATVRKIIRNPLFKGVAVMNKTHANFNTKKTTNNPKSEWIYREGLVPPIVSDELWDKANRLMDKRRVYITDEEKEKIKIGIKNNNSPFTSKIKCGLCGENFWYKTSTMANGRKIVYWCCSEYLKNGRKTEGSRKPVGAKAEKIHIEDSGCDNIRIKDEDLQNVVHEIAQKIYCDNENKSVSLAISVLKKLISNSETIKEQKNKLLMRIDKINNNRKKLLDRYLDDLITTDIYKSKDLDFQKEIDEINNKVSELDDTISQSKNNAARIQRIEQEIKEISDYDLAIKNVTNHVKCITVFPNKIVFSFDIFDDIIVTVDKINYKRVKYDVC